MLHSRRDGDRQDGQIIVLFELCLVVILACAALVIDLGLLRNNKQILVNTLDSAALAGAYTLPVDPAVPGHTAADAEKLIKANIKANFPSLKLGTDYHITYRCLVGADPVTGVPLISRDVPAMCDPRPSLGIVAPALPPASAFTGAGPRRISACDPVTHADKCNVVVIDGSETTPYSIAPVVGVTSGSTGTIVSAACNGSLCGQVIAAPVDLVIILDRTFSMTGTDTSGNNKIASLKTAAKAVLGVYDPAKQRVALALTGPSEVDAAGNPMMTCNSNTAYGTADDGNFFPTTTLSGASTTVSDAPTTTVTGPTTTVVSSFTTTLTSAITNTNGTSVKVASKTGFPATPFTIEVDTEQMTVSAVAGSSAPYTLTVARHANGSNVATHLNGAVVSLDVSTTDLTIRVASQTGFPATPFTIQVDSEQMTVSAVAGSSAPYTLTVARHANGTAAALHPDGAIVSLVVGTTDGTIQVVSRAGYPMSGNFTIQVDSEQMTVTGGQSTTTWNVTRHTNGTTAAVHFIGAHVDWVLGRDDTTVYVATITGFPTPPPNFTIQVDSEQMTVSVVAGSSAPYTLTVARGATKTAHAGGAAVTMVFSATDSTIRVASAIGFTPSGNFRILVDSEQMQVGSVSGTTTTTTTLNVTRHINSTSAAAHSSSATVSNLDGWTPPTGTTGLWNTAGVWVPVGLSGTDVVAPPSTDPPAYNPGGTGGDYHTTTSPIVKAINCITAASYGTTLATPIAMAHWYLNTYGRAGVTKGILLETDGQPQDPTGVGANRDTLPFTCGAAITEATKAKADGIKIYAVGYGVSASCQSTSTNSAETNPGMSATTLLKTIASGTTAPYYFNSPAGSTLASNFQQIATDLAKSGTQLIQLYPTPIVTSVSGTTTVTITGQYFTGADKVTFGGTAVTVSPGMTDTTMTVPILPAGCHGPVDVVVHTPTGGSSAITSASRYTCP
jgi:Putative Flp pilus-assembly TadE/G-like/von Willebrand factor type A domain